MTTSIPNPTTNLSTSGTGASAGAPGTASLHDAFAAIFAASPGGLPANSGQPATEFAAWMANPASGKTFSGPAAGPWVANAQLATPVVAPAVGSFTPPLVVTGLPRARPAVISSVRKNPAVASTTDQEPVGQKAVKRDEIETVAALLVPIFHAMPPVMPPAGQPASNAAGDSAEVSTMAKGELPGTMVNNNSARRLEGAALAAGKSAATAPTANPDAAPGKTSAATPALGQAVIDFGDSRPAITITLPGTVQSQAVSTTPKFHQVVSDLIGQALERSGVKLALPASPAALSTASTTATGGARVVPEISVSIHLPSIVTRPQDSADLVRSLPTAATAGTEPAGDGAKIAEAPEANQATPVFQDSAAERNFLVTEKEQVKDHPSAAGIGVAKPEANMPATSNARRNAATLPDSVPPVAQREMALTGGVAERAPLATEVRSSATPAPVLAHRAVETVLNVLDSQESRPPTAGVVNLHFKFGGDDLAVRVQLRGGEVHTQFSTDSADLRDALSTEWRTVASQGNPDGLRLAEPVFASSASGATHAFGSAPQGQSFSQQNSHQQPGQQAPATLPELRALRQQANPPAAEATANLPRQAVSLPTSIHLAAVA